MPRCGRLNRAWGKRWHALSFLFLYLIVLGDLEISLNQRDRLLLCLRCLCLSFPSSCYCYYCSCCVRLAALRSTTDSSPSFPERLSQPRSNIALSKQQHSNEHLNHMRIPFRPYVCMYRVQTLIPSLVLQNMLKPSSSSMNS